MEDISRDMEREIESGPSGTDFSKRPRRWDILLVKDDGKVISLPWFKKIIIAVLVLFTLVISLCLALFILHQSVLSEQKALRAGLERAMERNLILQADIEQKAGEIEEIKRALNSPESSMMGSGGESLKNSPGNNGGGEEKRRETENRDPSMNPTANPSKEASAEGEIVNPPVVQKREGGSAPLLYKVELDDFSATWKANNNSLKIYFVIKNISEKAKTLSGHIFVIVKPDDLDQKAWVVFPSVPLVSGRPGESRMGQFFAIRRFKTVRFILTDPLDYSKIKKATVFVYSDSGDLILEQDFVLNVTTQ